MEVLVIDGQGGRIGQQLIKAILSRYPEVELTAIGTNSLATSAMLKGGAAQGATGENALLVACRRADVILGPLGIVIADALIGGDLPGHGGGGGSGQGQADSHPPEPVRQPGGRGGGHAGGPPAGQRRGRAGPGAEGIGLTARRGNSIINQNSGRKPVGGPEPAQHVPAL